MMKTHQLYLNEGIKETFISCGRIPPIVLKISFGSNCRLCSAPAVLIFNSAVANGFDNVKYNACFPYDGKYAMRISWRLSRAKCQVCIRKDSNCIVN